MIVDSVLLLRLAALAFELTHTHVPERQLPLDRIDKIGVIPKFQKIFKFRKTETHAISKSRVRRESSHNVFFVPTSFSQNSGDNTLERTVHFCSRRLDSFCTGPGTLRVAMYTSFTRRIGAAARKVRKI